MADPSIPDDEAERKRQKYDATQSSYLARYHSDPVWREERKAYIRAYYEMPENKERKRAVARAYYLKKRDAILSNMRANSEEIAAKKRQARQDNLEATRAKGRAYAKAAKRRALADKNSGDPDGPYAKYARRNSKTLKKWRANNPEQYKAQVATRAARERGALGVHTGDDIARIRKQQRDRCAYCRALLRGKGHIDHIIAVSKGGSNLPSNLQLACQSCNTRKNAADPIEFAQKMGMLL